MKVLITALLVASSAHAALDMKPGLWNVVMKVKQDGKAIDPMAEMKKAMAKMPADQKKMMTERMAKMGVSANGDTHVCYTDEMIKDPQKLTKQNTKCETKILNSSANAYSTSFTCQDGSKGTAKWDVPNKETMTGLVNVTNAKGKKAEVDYKGKFVKADCGEVQPPL